MARFRLDSMAALARQMTFTPHDTLVAQLVSAEELLHNVDPSKAYPLDFVVFRITGYHPRRVNGDLLTGLALQHDLGLLIERLSDSLDIQTNCLSEPVLDINDVSERFNVTSKTIQRWRRRGLPARKFLYPDGKRRVGFLLSSVERFFAARQNQLGPQINLTQLGSCERDFIIRHARRLASRCCEAEIARRIARKLDRSTVTVLHTLRKHDQDNPADAILPGAPPAHSADEAARIVRAYRRGASIKTLSMKYACSCATIYRAIMDERISRLNRWKIKFIDDPLYHWPQADAAVQEIVSQQPLDKEPRPEESRIPRDLPAYLQDLYRTPLLTPGRERALFLQFNYHKYQFVQARRRLEPQFARAADLDHLEQLLHRVTQTKNAIVRANLRLVVSVARKHLRPGLNLMELISDGNLTLMRAVESFDLHKGNRFSTYATLALMKGFARSVPAMQALRRACSAGQGALADVPDSRDPLAIRRLMARDEIGRLLDRLSQSERAVLLAHYGLDSRMGDQSSPASYEEVGRQLGLSRQRVRQIEHRAIQKLRTSAQAS